MWAGSFDFRAFVVFVWVGDLATMCGGWGWPRAAMDLKEFGCVLNGWESKGMRSSACGLATTQKRERRGLGD